MKKAMTWYRKNFAVRPRYQIFLKLQTEKYEGQLKQVKKRLRLKFASYIEKSERTHGT